MNYSLHGIISMCTVDGLLFFKMYLASKFIYLILVSKGWMKALRFSIRYYAHVVL